MKTKFCVVLVGVGMVAFRTSLCAQSVVDVPPSPQLSFTSEPFHFTDDANEKGQALLTKFEPLVVSAETAKKGVPLARYVVGVAKLPRFDAPHESKVQELLRTGTIAEHVGKKVTTKLWTGGGRLMMTISW